MPRSIFITATDTHAGKTWVTSSLLKTCLAQGLDIQALKPIASGFNVDGCNEDVAILLAEQPHKQPQDINFITYDLPLAPALAAQKQGSDLQPDALNDWLEAQNAKHDITLIEGVGGLMVPLLANDETQWLVSDWLQTMAGVEVMLVVPLQLGCMNQTLLSCQYLQSIGKPPTWLVFNDMKNTGGFEDTCTTIQPFLEELLDDMPQTILLHRAGMMPNLW
ncbi:MAG TPA: dethiobiotin synthase [Ghiorsea sp.]|nr:dethiobiotin synthase [Ghiorsea sp.]HIP07031.1 dethiobiotin synthase [Mariprofundaceae bacterium]